MRGKWSCDGTQSGEAALGGCRWIFTSGHVMEDRIAAEGSESFWHGRLQLALCMAFGPSEVKLKEAVVGLELKPKRFCRRSSRLDGTRER